MNSTDRFWDEYRNAVSGFMSLGQGDPREAFVVQKMVDALASIVGLLENRIKALEANDEAAS